jgi:mannose-1-phosphate guanylyltransferase
MIIVIRAGGVGSRLWPLSRTTAPKQFHALVSDRTMLQEAVDRVVEIVTPDALYISTNVSAASLVVEQCPEVHAENIIVEPARRDTAAAIGLESIMIRKKHPQAIVASLGSDHRVRNVSEFQAVLRTAVEFVTEHPETIVPIGVQPTQPDSGYGYIQCGPVIEERSGRPLWQVTRFTEKPALEQARSFVQAGNYLWNANMFVWNVSTILDLYKEHLPEMYDQLLVIEAALGTPKQDEVIARVYPQLEQIAIDYAIIEKATSIAAIAANIGWNDIGDWARLKDELADQEADNVAIGGTQFVARSTTNTLVNSTRKNKIIATIGVKNLVIIDTEDALLICDKYHSAEVKKIVEELEQQQRTDVL